MLAVNREAEEIAIPREAFLQVVDGEGGGEVEAVERGHGSDIMEPAVH
jgi:hypothetical protein